MTSPAPSPDMLRRALNQTRAVLAAAEPDLVAARPTPCRSWTVGTLADHIIDDLAQFQIALQGGKPDWDKPVPAADGPWLTAFDRGASQLTSEWEGVDMTAEVELPFGTVPMSFVVGQQIAEFTVHSWDLATAIAAETPLDEELAEVALALAQGALAPEFRGSEEEGKPFGPLIQVSADAPAYDRVAAFFGRNPH